MIVAPRRVRICPRLSSGSNSARDAQQVSSEMPASMPTATAARAFETLCSPSRCRCSGRVRFAEANADTLAFGTERFDRFSFGIGAWSAAEVNGLAAKVAPELGDVSVVAVQERDAVQWQSFDQFIFSARNACDAVGEEFSVGTANIGDDPPVGSGDASKSRDLSGSRTFPSR